MNMYKDASANIFTWQKKEYQNNSRHVCFNIHLRKLQATIKKVWIYSIKFWH